MERREVATIRQLEALLAPEVPLWLTSGIACDLEFQLERGEFP